MAIRGDSLRRRFSESHPAIRYGSRSCGNAWVADQTPLTRHRPAYIAVVATSKRSGLGQGGSGARFDLPQVREVTKNVVPRAEIPNRRSVEELSE
jgi:hypothetical protein